MLDFLTWLQNTRLAVAVSEVWFPYVESVHVIATAIVAGTIFIVDTRLIGLTSTHLTFNYISNRLLPWTWGAFIVSVATGTLMFMGNATGYYTNTPFRVKMVLLALAGVNMLYFHAVTFRHAAKWNAVSPPLAARAAGIFSLGLWCGVIGFGRWIGFV
jgi:hypothetical protein